MSVSVLCALCERGSLQPQFAYGDYGEFDPGYEDGRPWRHDTFPLTQPGLLDDPQACPWCGYCAIDLEVGLAGAEAVLGRAPYRATLRDERFPLLARIFRAVALLAEHAGDHDTAWLARTQAAWICDDRGLTAEAARCRQVALGSLERIRSHLARLFDPTRDRRPPPPDQNDLLDPSCDPRVLAAIDLYRRTGQFEVAQLALSRLRESGPEDDQWSWPLREQRRLVAARDAGLSHQEWRHPDDQGEEELARDRRSVAVMAAFAGLPMALVLITAPGYRWLGFVGLMLTAGWVALQGSRGGCAALVAMVVLGLPVMSWLHPGVLPAQVVLLPASLLCQVGLGVLICLLLDGVRDGSVGGDRAPQYTRPAPHLHEDGWRTETSARFDPDDWR